MGKNTIRADATTIGEEKSKRYLLFGGVSIAAAAAALFRLSASRGSPSTNPLNS